MSTAARVRQWPAALRLLVFGTVLLTALWLTGTALARALGPRSSPPAGPLAYPAHRAGLAAPPGQPGPGGDPTRRTLILYDEVGDPPTLGHQYAIQAANLVSRGSAWTMRPMRSYRSGDLMRYQAAIYISADGPDLPQAFLTDVLRDQVPVLWMGDGIDQVFSQSPDVASRLGWKPGGPDQGKVTGVIYHGRTLTRNDPGNSPLTTITLTSGNHAEVLGWATHADGSTTAWAVRSGALTYIGDIPFDYAEPGDRYLAMCDLILRLVEPKAPRRLRALIRIEDVGPNTKPEQIVAISDFLSSRGVPFSLAVYPYYRDPRGAQNSGKPTEYRLVDRPKLVDALRY
ncbi:MAG TPA: DUF2334 domain-containing protein, partial [Micromonosporaceae bacterium]